MARLSDSARYYSNSGKIEPAQREANGGMLESSYPPVKAP